MQIDSDLTNRLEQIDINDAYTKLSYRGPKVPVSASNARYTTES